MPGNASIARVFAIAALPCLLLVACATSRQVDRADSIARALAAPDRPPAEAARDAPRHSAQLLAFSRVAPGERALDVGSGGGYFTRLLSALVGPDGHVTAQDAPSYVKNVVSERAALLASRSNVSGMLAPFESLEGEPGTYDLVTIILMYHDVVRLGDRERMNRRIFELLKPGGRLLVVDHAAVTGSGLRDAGTLHRIDPVLVQSEMEAAGLQLLAQSDAVRNVDDDMSRTSFDPRFRWHTNQFALLFVKPPVGNAKPEELAKWRRVSGFQVDVTLLPQWRQTDTLDNLRRQIQVVEAAKLPAEMLAFFRRVPIVIDPSLAESNAGYTPESGNSLIRAHPGGWPAGRAILLHELLHAYHHDVIGHSAPDIERAYAQAQKEGVYPADYRGTYFLSNAREYFAVIGEAYLSGPTFRPPFRCSTVQKTQPEFIAYLGGLFGEHPCQ